jgi:hypothetical protein
MLHDLIFELLHYKPDKTSDHNTWFVWLPSYFIRDSLRVLKLADCFCATVCWLEVHVFALWKQIDVRPCCVFRACIQELSQLHRNTGRNIGFSPYYFSCVKHHGRVLFTLQLTVTRVLYVQDRDCWNSLLFTSCDHACVSVSICTEHLKIDASFQVSVLHGIVVSRLSFLMGALPERQISVRNLEREWLGFESSYI